MAPQTSANQNPDLKLCPAPESQDYYMENGLLVFKSTYHEKRGFCCKNNCRHCPYRSKR
jgi:hypothetical protein